MPRISEFFGIAVYMYFDDHSPPHFHARYAEHEGLVAIDSLRVLAGSLPPRVLGMVMEWAAQHREELAENWERARQELPLNRIAPLE
ncbi:MAG: DUF4160 domain-containing protein [Planctomycetota bacterium]|jgi:hypothetical protein